MICFSCTRQLVCVESPFVGDCQGWVAVIAADSSYVRPRAIELENRPSQVRVEFAGWIRVRIPCKYLVGFGGCFRSIPDEKPGERVGLDQNDRYIRSRCRHKSGTVHRASQRRPCGDRWDHFWSISSRIWQLPSHRCFYRLLPEQIASRSLVSSYENSERAMHGELRG